MACRQCVGLERQFDDRTARKELKRWRRKGPARSTRLLLDALDPEDVKGATFLDVGGGIGAIQHDLMARGARGGTHADASPAYLEAARSEAEARGHADRVRYVAGDFVDVAGDVEDADLVTLDRVVCCYHDMEALVDASASRARRVYALVFPRVKWYTRLAFRAINVVQRLRRHPFHVFLHPTEAVEERVRGHGFRKRHQAHTFLWQIHLYTRAPAV